MPTQEPFSPEGVAAKIEDLYALSDPALIAEANEAKANFTDWIIANFLLNQDQEGYLMSMDTAWLDASSEKFHDALIGRRPIELIKPYIVDPNTYSSKVIRTEEEAIVVFNQISGTEHTGSLKFIISIED